MPQASQTRTPFGGMNQDDSMVTPTMDAAGKNMFEIGDYRYALNARIGSSRSEHFGDLENIRSTVEVTDYYATQQLFENYNFDGNLDGWSQLDESEDYIEWAYNSNAARLTLTPDTPTLPGDPAPVFVAKGFMDAGFRDGEVVEDAEPIYMDSILPGDLLFLFTFNGTVADPTWAQIASGVFNTSLSAPAGESFLYMKIADGSETGGVTVAIVPGATNCGGQIYQYRGADGIDGVAINNTGDGALTVEWNAVTLTPGGKRTLVAFSCQVTSSGLPNTPTGYVNTAQDTSDVGPSDFTLKNFTREDVLLDGLVSASGGAPAGWITFHLSIHKLVVTPMATPFVSEVFYQDTDVPVAGNPVNIQFNISISDVITSGTIKLVYLNGTSIISEEIVSAGSITSMVFNEDRTLPALCDGVGVRVSGTIIVPVIVDLEYLKVFSTFGTPSIRPSGNEKVIGRFEDYEFQRLYYCVWNSEGNHCIRYYDAFNNYVVEVLQWAGLNWDSDYFVKMAKLDNWMAFTDRHNPPRLIDVETISALKAELGDDEFREFHISFHKWAPTVPPIPRIYYDGVTNNFDLLKDKVYHFAYRYVYEGNLKSRWSPISKGATTCYLRSSLVANDTITAIEIDIPGAILDVPGASVEYNYFDHTDIKFTTVVKYIELAFNDGEQELWKYWKRITVTPSFERLHYFNGNGLLTPIPQDDFNQPFDAVPFLAGTVEAIDNRFVFGDCLDEKPPLTFMEVNDVSSNQDLDEWNNASSSAFSGISAIPQVKLQRLNALSMLTFKDRAQYKFGIQFLYPTGWRSGVYTSEDWFYTVPDVGGQASGTLNVALQFTLPALFTPPEEAVGYQIMRTNALNISYYMFGIVNRFVLIVDDVNDVVDSLELPDSVKTRLNTHFENVQRISADEVIAQTQKLLEEEIEINRKKDKKIKRRNRLLRANRLFEISSTGMQSHSLTLEKWARRNPAGPILQQELRKTKEISALAAASRIFIDINNWVFGAKEDTDEEFPLNKLFYNFVPGDRVRFVGSDVADPTNDQLKEYDVPILEYTGKGLIIEKPEGMLWISTPTDESPRNFNIEVYTPRVASEQDHVFFEMGEWYPILYPGTNDRDFAKRDFVYTEEAAVTLSQYGPFDIFHKIPVYYGDSYAVGKTVYRDDVAEGWVGPNSSPIFMSMNPDLNKTFDYWDKNNGRPAIAYDDLPVVRFKPTQCRFGGKIIEESFVNNLNNVREEDQFIYPSEYGRIRDLVNTANAQVESVGAILLAIGEREAWSIYVNRTTLEDLSGRTQVALSDDVLGSYNTLLGSHGTLNPESVSKSRGRVYWWNALDGSWVRYGRDGITEISEYKMRNWFSELSDLLIDKYQSDEKPHVISEFDPFNRQLIVFQDHSTLPGTFRGYANYKGAMFSEDDTRWKSCHNLTPEMMGKVNNQVIMFKNGGVFRFEKGETYSTFFGQKYNVMWEPVFNDTPALKKVWHALALVATDGWSVERILSEYRGQRSKQQTSIPMTSFDEREDNYYAAIKRNINTPNKVNPIIEGDAMRSKAIQVLMQMDPSIDNRLSLLHYVMAETADSPKNP